MENKRGLSAVVATLIIILLVLVAVGIIWVVVRNVVQSGSEQVEFSQKCFQVNLQCAGVTDNGDGTYNITLKRLAGGDDIAGIMVSLLSATEGSTPEDFGSLGALETSTVTIPSTGSISFNATKVEYTAYFEDSSGNPVYCTTREYAFS